MKELKVPRASLRSSREILLVDLLLLLVENFGSAFFMKVVKAPKSSKACLLNLSCPLEFLL